MFQCEAIVSPLTTEDVAVVDADEGEEVERGMADEVRRVKKFQSPFMPSEGKINDHEVTGHLPLRSWCAHCNRGRGPEEAHRCQDQCVD